MKKKKINFDAEFWASDKITCPLKLIEAFFQYDDLNHYKHVLTEVGSHAYEKKVYKQEYPGDVFMFYLCMRSFIRACYLLQFKNKKWETNDPPEFTSYLLQGCLTDEEYINPFLVFRKAFEEVSLKEFDYFLKESIHLSLCPCSYISDSNMISPLVYLLKMLDASRIIHERGVDKIKKNKN